MMAENMARIKRNVRKMVTQGAPEADIDAYIASEGVTIEDVRAFSGGGAAPNEKPSAAYEAAQQFGTNFNRGLYSMLNAPTAIANAGMSLVGADYRFDRPLEVVAPGADKAIMNPPEAQTAAGRIAGTVGEYAGANALPAGGMIAAAPRIAAATANATGLAGQTVNRMASGIAAAPGTAAAGEALSTIGSGLGAQIARDAAPGNATAEFLAATAGGIAAPAALALSPTNIARKGVNAARKRLSPEAAARAQRKQVVDGFRRHMTPEAEASIREAVDLQDNIPGYKPSVAEATESPSFIATQREFEAGMSGPDLDRATRRYALNERAIRDAVADQAPQSTMSPDDALHEARARPTRLNRRIDAATQQVDDMAAMQADIIAPNARRAALGESIRAQIDEELADVKGRMSDLASRMGLNGTDARYRFDDGVKQRLANSVARRSDLADASAQPSGIVSDIAKMDDQVSITDLIALRSRITDDIRTYTALPEGKRRVQYLEALKSELDAVADDVIRASGDDTIADNWQRFRSIYREELIEPFEQGAMGRVRAKGRGGAYRVPHERVAKEFFNGWSQTAAQQYRKAFKDARYAHATMEAAALDDLYASAVVDGVIDPGRLKGWMRRHQGVLGEFPEIKARVDGIERSTQAIAGRRAVLAARRKRVEQSYLSRELARMDSPMASTTAEDVIEQAIRNPARMRKLMQSVKSGPGRAAIARHAWEHALSQPDPAAFMRTHGRAMQMALRNRFGSAQRLARAIEKQSIVPRPAGQGVDANPIASIENIMGTGLNQISSRIFAVKSGRTSARYALADIAGRAFRTMTGAQARQTLHDAIYDPQVAVDLANIIEGKRLTPRTANRVYTYLVSNGIVAATNDDDAGGGGEPLQVDIP